MLSEDEKAVLSKGPKFAIRQQVMEENFKVELEKMICKEKFNSDQDIELSPSLSAESSSVSAETCSESVSTNQNPPAKTTCRTSSMQHGSTSAVSSFNLDQMFEEKRSQLVYDFKGKNLNPNRMKATDYRFNRSTFLPRPQTAENELKHEIRKSESLKVFQKVVAKNPSKKPNASKIPYACRSNLTQNEQNGLKSLQKRVASGEIVICESD